MVSRVTDQNLFKKSLDVPGIGSVAFKRTIPSLISESPYKRQKRIKSLMLELRVLAHDPIRNHENIVNLLGIAWETDHLDFSRKWPVLIMERAVRGTLSNFLDHSDPKSFQIKVALALDVVFGLKALHKCGILHGDVKADNVLIFENRDPKTSLQRPVIAKLGDFSGVLFDMKGLMELPSGTQPWNAPEWRQLLTPESLLTTDVYSLGFLIFIIMADGKHPFRDFSPYYSTDSSWDQVDSLKSGSQLLEHMKSLSGFREDVDASVLHSIFDYTLCLVPEARSLDKVEAILQEVHYQRR
jgi:serine/threonine protein kinase